MAGIISMTDTENTIEYSNRPSPVLGLRFVEDGEKFYLARDTTSEGMELNAPLALIYQLCDGSRTVQDIVELIQQCYEEGIADDIHEHVVLGIRQLADNGAITLS